MNTLGPTPFGVRGGYKWLSALEFFNAHKYDSAYAFQHLSTYIKRRRMFHISVDNPSRLVVQAGAPGQTRTGTMFSRWILNPLRLPIPPRGHFLTIKHCAIRVITPADAHLKPWPLVRWGACAFGVATTSHAAGSLLCAAVTRSQASAVVAGSPQREAAPGERGCLQSVLTVSRRDG